ncbi:MAG TPA: outer membrane beta-barrel protein [Pyrinomonadaceae bacterium]|nr:outer membrane beta-barrel protein [Pyrinomonadaceae bacterium]
MKHSIFLLLSIFLVTSVAVAQSKKEKIEIGVQTTSLTLFEPEFSSFDSTQAGVGGRVTYNFNRSIAAEAEINFFPQKQFILTADGSAIQAQFGVKAGKRFEKFGIFGKVRPGFLSVNRVGSLIPGPTFAFTIDRRAFFTLNAGGVLELYPSKKLVVRFDAGDTMVRHPALFGQTSILDPSISLIRPAKFNHNFQFTAGVAFRLGEFPDDGNVDSSSGGPERTRRYEVGAQFTSLFVTPGDTPVQVSVPRMHVEPGLGGRFTFNLTENIAFEAEGNYFTRLRFDFPQGGHMFQGQFGGKVGKRFERWGVFGKARPGFVGFTRVFDAPVQVPPIFQTKTKFYPSIDVGGVVEFYISPRWMARFDAGDTMIRYAEIGIPAFGFPFIIQQKAWRHNLQVSSGIGFRF